MGQSSTNSFYGCSVNLTTPPWKSTCCCIIVFSDYKQHTVVHTSIKFSNCFLTYNFFRKKCLRQPSIDFDFSNLSSSGDVVYKERWWHWHKLVTDLFYDFMSYMQNAIKLENISNLITSPSSYQCRETTVNMKVCGFCYYMHFHLLTSIQNVS